MSVKVTYIISNINKAVAFEWITQSLNSQKFELNFILLNKSETPLERYLITHNIKVKRINFTNKYDIPKSIFITISILLRDKPDIVHAHLFEANIIGLLAAWICRVKKRIYTRHHSDLHHKYYPKAVKYDKLCNFLSTNIIAISEPVKEILNKLEGVPLTKIHLIHHGFKIKDFHINSETEINELRIKYSTRNFYPIIGVISRYVEWKGIQYVIPAFKTILLKYPNAKLILANAKGDFDQEIKTLLKEIPIENYAEIEFEEKIFSLYKLFDIFIHVPVSRYAEAFGQTYIECMLTGIPLIATKSGIGDEILVDKKNSIIVNYQDTSSITQSIELLLEKEELKTEITKNASIIANNNFNIENMINKLEKLYVS